MQNLKQQFLEICFIMNIKVMMAKHISLYIFVLYFVYSL